MSEETDIFEELIASGIDLVGNLVRDASEQNKYYAFARIARDKEGAQRPSNFMLRQLSEKFEQRIIHLSFILVEDEAEDLQGSIKATLFRFFPDLVRNAFVASEGVGVTVWVEPKKAPTHEEADAISSKITDILEVLGIRLDAVKITSTENVPTRTACLNSIRLKSPLTLEELQAALIERKFHIPNEDWLSNMLDRLRRSGLVLRRKDGQFLLTLSGLRSLGSAKNRRSPDVSRALDIAKRGA